MASKWLAVYPRDVALLVAAEWLRLEPDVREELEFSSLSYVAGGQSRLQCYLCGLANCNVGDSEFTLQPVNNAGPAFLPLMSVSHKPCFVGQGLFAKLAIRKGTVIMEYPGQWYPDTAEWGRSWLDVDWATCGHEPDKQFFKPDSGPYEFKFRGDGVPKNMRYVLSHCPAHYINAPMNPENPAGTTLGRANVAFIAGMKGTTLPQRPVPSQTVSGMFVVSVVAIDDITAVLQLHLLSPFPHLSVSGFPVVG